jgi:hypothetical protein
MSERWYTRGWTVSYLRLSISVGAGGPRVIETYQLLELFSFPSFIVWPVGPGKLSEYFHLCD